MPRTGQWKKKNKKTNVQTHKRMATNAHSSLIFPIVWPVAMFCSSGHAKREKPIIRDYDLVFQVKRNMPFMQHFCVLHIPIGICLYIL